MRQNQKYQFSERCECSGRVCGESRSNLIMVILDIEMTSFRLCGPNKITRSLHICARSPPVTQPLLQSTRDDVESQQRPGPSPLIQRDQRDNRRTVNNSSRPQSRRLPANFAAYPKNAPQGLPGARRTLGTLPNPRPAVSSVGGRLKDRLVEFPEADSDVLELLRPRVRSSRSQSFPSIRIQFSLANPYQSSNPAK